MRKVKKYVCPECNKPYTSLSKWIDHMSLMHPNSIPRNMTPSQYFYYLITGKDRNACIECKKDTPWNEASLKYARYCLDPRCKQNYCKEAKQRMMNTHDGQIHLLNDPEMQRKMSAAKKTSGVFKFDDGGEIGFSSSYDKHFVEMVNRFMNWSSADLMQSPHTYYYYYINSEDVENEGKKFYIPDYYIPSLNLEIEIKQNTSTHHKILRVDKVKEKCKDEAMKKILHKVNYIKIVDKNYEEFFNYLIKRKELFEIPDKDPSYIATEATENINDYYGMHIL